MKLRKLSKLLALLATIIIAAPALAQVNCDAVLREGVFDVSTGDHQITTSEMLFRHTCNSSMTDTQTGGTYYGISGHFNQQRTQNACATFNRNRFMAASDITFFRTANAAILAAWQHCTESQTGLSFSLAQASTPGLVRGVVKWRSSAVPAVDASAVVALPASEFGSCEMDPSAHDNPSTPVAGGLAMRVPSGGSATFRCRRMTTGPITAGLTSNQGDRDASLPAISANPAILPPVGSIPTFQTACTWPPDGAVNIMGINLRADDVRDDTAISFQMKGPYGNFNQFITVADFDAGNHQTTLTNIPMSVLRSVGSRRAAGLYASTPDGGQVRILQTVYRNCPHERSVGRISTLTVRLERHNILDVGRVPAQ
jgi:hypothetical protein